MPRTVIGLDDEARAGATRRIGATTEKDTADAAPHGTAGLRHRAESIARMRQLVAEGKIDLSTFPVGDSAPGKPVAGPSPA